MLTRSTSLKRLGLSFLLLFPLALGCGSGLEEFPTATTTGLVTCGGTPVAHVRVYFSPQAPSGGVLAGKSGWGTTEEDGTFVISTYGDEDGAVVGTHNVSVGAPHAERFPDFQCPCETNGNKSLMTIEVTDDGENNFTIDLPAKTPRSRRQPTMSEDDLDDIRSAD